MLITNKTHKREYNSIVLGIFHSNDEKTVSYELYNNNTTFNFEFKGTNKVLDEKWIEFKCEGSSIQWTKLDGTNKIDLGQWVGFRKIEFKIKIPENEKQEKYNFKMKINTEEMDFSLAINYNIDIKNIINSELFGNI